MDEDAFLLAQAYAEAMQEIGRGGGHPGQRMQWAAVYAAAAVVAGLAPDDKRLEALRRGVQAFEKMLAIEEARAAERGGGPPPGSKVN